MLGRPAIQITPEEFELEVKAVLEAAGYTLDSFQVSHRERLAGVDGVYEIDIVVRFEVLGGGFCVLVECKRYKNAVKRDVVESLHSRIRSIGAHKGFLFATSDFQRGAVEYAACHGIALVTLIDGKSTYVTRSIGPSMPPPPWLEIPKYSGCLHGFDEEGRRMFSGFSVKDPDRLRDEIESARSQS